MTYLRVGASRDAAPPLVAHRPTLRLMRHLLRGLFQNAEPRPRKQQEALLRAAAPRVLRDDHASLYAEEEEDEEDEEEKASAVW